MDFNANAGGASGQGSNAPVQSSIDMGLPTLTKDFITVGTTEFSFTAQQTTSFNYVVFTVSDVFGLAPGLFINYQTYKIDKVVYTISPYGFSDNDIGDVPLALGLAPYTRNFSIADGTFGSESPETLPGAVWHLFDNHNFNESQTSRNTAVSNQQYLTCTINPQYQIQSDSAATVNNSYTYASNPVSIFDNQGLSGVQWRGLVQELRLNFSFGSNQSFTHNVIAKYTITFEGTRLLTSLPSTVTRHLLGSNNMGKNDPKSFLYRPAAKFGFSPGPSDFPDSRERQGESTPLSCSPALKKELQKHSYIQSARDSLERHMAEASRKKRRRHMGSSNQAMDALFESKREGFSSPGHAKGSILSSQYKKRKQREEELNKNRRDSGQGD